MIVGSREGRWSSSNDRLAKTIAASFAYAGRQAPIKWGTSYAVSMAYTALNDDALPRTAVGGFNSAVKAGVVFG